MVDKLPSLNWCRFFQPSTVWLVFLPLVMDLTSRHDLFCYWNIRTGRWLKSKSSRVGIEKPSLSHQLFKTTLLSKDDFNFLPPTTFEISKNKYTIYLMLQMLISFRGNQWEMFLLVGFTYSIILWAKVMWRRTSPKYLASLICKLNTVFESSWIFEYSWMGMVGRCRLLHTPQPDFCLINGVSLHLPRCKEGIMVRQAIESHQYVVVFQIWSPNFVALPKYMTYPLKYQKSHLWKTPFHPTSLLGLLDATSHGSGNHGPASRRPNTAVCLERLG